MHIIDRLKEFYLLEAFQVELYGSWINSATDEYSRHVYEQLIIKEQEHTDFFKQKLEEFGAAPPVVTGGITSLAGKIWGEVVDLAGTNNSYKMGIFGENKAIEMYQAFILEAWEYPDLVETLWKNMIDEEHHMLWFKAHLEST